MSARKTKHGGARKGAGRKPTKFTRHQVMLDAESVRFAKLFGEGELSAGLRFAVQRAKESLPLTRNSSEARRWRGVDEVPDDTSFYRGSLGVPFGDLEIQVQVPSKKFDLLRGHALSGEPVELKEFGLNGSFIVALEIRMESPNTSSAVASFKVRPA